MLFVTLLNVLRNVLPTCILNNTIKMPLKIRQCEWDCVIITDFTLCGGCFRRHHKMATSVVLASVLTIHCVGHLFKAGETK